MLSVTNDTIMLNVVAPLNIIHANHFSKHALLPMLPGTAFTASLFYKGLLNELHVAVLLWLHYQYRRAPANN
jgi:hypothetical protein